MADKAIRWEIYKDINKEFRARFRAGNGEIVLVTSESYIDKADCNDAIDLLELAVIERCTAGMAVAKARIPRIEVEE